MRRLGFSSQRHTPISDRDICSTVGRFVTADEACCRLVESLTALLAVSQWIQLA